MARSFKSIIPAADDCLLSIEQLEDGIRFLGQADVDQDAFWDENIESFRQTVLFAMRETSDALRSPRITLRWSLELESQLEALARYIELADRYIARRSVSSEPIRPPLARIH